MKIDIPSTKCIVTFILAQTYNPVAFLLQIPSAFTPLNSKVNSLNPPFEPSLAVHTYLPRYLGAYTPFSYVICLASSH